MPTTTELTEKYIREHTSIKECLKKGLINYSSLSRLIFHDLELSKKTSKEAILIAARRFKEKVKNTGYEKEIHRILQESNIEIKNNIIVFTIEKMIYPDALIDIEKSIKKKQELFFSIEGTKTITLIVQKSNQKKIQSRFKKFIVSTANTLSLITINSSGIGKTPGVVNYISGLFYENDINIVEFMSCYDDTLVVIDSNNLEKAMRFLNF